MSNLLLCLTFVLSSAVLLEAQDPDPPLWHIGEPLQIGTVFGEPHNEFGSIGGAVELTNGTIVVAETQSDEIRFFDPTGAFLRKQGREGEGPGEYLFVRALAECGRNRVFAVDNRQNRMTVLSEPGEVVRTTELPAPGGPGGLYRFACDTTGLIVVASWPDESAALRAPTERAFSTEFIVALADSMGGVSRVIGEFPGGERVFQFVDGQIRGAAPREFGTETFVASGGGRAYIGYSGRPEIQIAESGQLRTARIPVTQRAISGEELRAFREDAVSRAPEGAEAEVRRRWRDYDFPESYPFFSDLHADPSGNLWVRRYPASGEAEVEWLVLDAGLRPIGRIVTPVDFAVTDVGTDYLLGVWTDENQVEYVRRYEVIRNE